MEDSDGNRDKFSFIINCAGIDAFVFCLLT